MGICEMQKNKIIKNMFIFLVVLLCDDIFAMREISGSYTPQYDYTQTKLIILYDQNGDYVLLANPFEFPNSMGGLVYEVILHYAPQFQRVSSLPEAPSYILDLTMRDKYDKERIGQRLYLGETWLSDGEYLSVMVPEDYQRISQVLNARYLNSEHYAAKELGRLRRPKLSELPDGWLEQRVSLEESIKRFEPSGYHFADEAPTDLVSEPQRIIKVKQNVLAPTPVRQLKQTVDVNKNLQKIDNRFETGPATREKLKINLGPPSLAPTKLAAEGDAELIMFTVTDDKSKPGGWGLISVLSFVALGFLVGFFYFKMFK
jgi:hypothetical protein